MGTGVTAIHPNGLLEVRHGFSKIVGRTKLVMGPTLEKRVVGFAVVGLKLGSLRLLVYGQIYSKRRYDLADNFVL